MKPAPITFRLFLLLTSLILSSTAIAEEAFEWAPEYSAGDSFPEATVVDETGRTLTLGSMTGEKGYLIAFNRSVVW